MARLVIRCQYTGHYVLTGVEATSESVIASGGRIFCPYCATEHAWSCTDARAEQRPRKPLVRQAS